LSSVDSDAVAGDCCELLPWDSAFFGVRIARVVPHRLTVKLVADVDRWATDRGVACVYFLADARDDETISLAEHHGYRLISERVTYKITIAMTSPASADGRGDAVRAAAEADLPALEAIAEAAHSDSRFYADDHFPRARCDELYRSWIRNSVHGYADAVLVCDDHAGPNGYVTCHLQSSRHSGSIGLLAVRQNSRGNRLGRRLMEASIAWFAARGARNVSVVTQGRNVAAQRLYERCGFLTSSVELDYHKWYTDAPARSPGEPL
jgi:dTDP-4-amino-4,6-dideoxy-D-galactose acyltransferase